MCRGRSQRLKDSAFGRQRSRTRGRSAALAFGPHAACRSCRPLLPERAPQRQTCGQKRPAMRSANVQNSLLRSQSSTQIRNWRRLCICSCNVFEAVRVDALDALPFGAVIQKTLVKRQPIDDPMVIRVHLQQLQLLIHEFSEESRVLVLNQ